MENTMPFNQPFRNHYTAGDLIYGLATTRSKLVIHFGAAIINAGGGAVTVDQYRKSLVEQRPKPERTAWKQFLRDNERHPRYGEYALAIRKYDNDEEKFAEAELRADLQNAAWRSKSKFGMEWILNGDRGHIHFVLDDIDMAAVVTKTHHFADPISGDVLARDFPRGKAPADADNKERTITHSELRWIYRNRTNPKVSGGVQFWLSGGGGINACPPPWDNAQRSTTMPTSGVVKTWQQAWAVYRPTTERSTF
jgi:hypothetical protein